MPKLKTSKSINKRFKLTATGKLLRHQAGRSHLLQKKTTRRKKRLCRTTLLNSRNSSALILKLPRFL